MLFKIYIMKNLFPILITLLISSNIFSQIFPGKDVNLFLNKDVTPKFKNLQNKYENFYSVYDKSLNTYKKEDKIFPVGPKYSLSSDTSKLNNQTFKVSNIYTLNDQYNKDTYYCLELINENIGTLYYIYDSRFQHDLELRFSDLNQIDDDVFCNKIEKRIDKFNDENVYGTPILDDLKFNKYESKSKISYVLSIKYYINNNGHNPVVDAKGVNILLSNNVKISFPNQNIDVEATEKGFVYSAFISITNKQFNDFKENEITDFKVYAYSKEVNKDNRKVLKRYLKCL